MLVYEFDDDCATRAFCLIVLLLLFFVVIVVVTTPSLLLSDCYIQFDRKFCLVQFISLSPVSLLVLHFILLVLLLVVITIYLAVNFCT